MYIKSKFLHAYVHVCVYICTQKYCRAESWSKICLFKGQNWSKFSCFSFFVSSFCSENDIIQNKGPPQKSIWTIFKSRTGPIMLRNILGPSLTYVWTNVLLFCCCTYAETTIFIMLSENAFLSPLPKIRNTIRWTQLRQLKKHFVVLFFCIFVFWDVCRVRFFVPFLRGMKNKKQNSKQKTIK